MSLSLFPEAFQKAGRTSVDAATALRALRDSTGDMSFSLIDRAQGALGNAKVATAQALTEGNKQPTNAEAQMAAQGLNLTMAEFFTKASTITAMADAFHQAAITAIHAMPVDQLIDLALRGPAGLQYEMLHYPEVMPSAIADTLRQSPELANLITEFESIGA